MLLAVAFTFYMGGLRVDAASLDGSNFAHAQENAYKLLGTLTVSGDAVDILAAVRACIRGIYQGLDQQKEE